MPSSVILYSLNEVEDLLDLWEQCGKVGDVKIEENYFIVTQREPMNVINVYGGQANVYIKSSLDLAPLAQLIVKEYNANQSILATNLYDTLRKLDKDCNLIVSPRALHGAKHYITIQSTLVVIYTVFNEYTNTTLFSGNFTQLNDKFNPVTKLSGMSGKLLRFKYDGGSEAGMRIIRLEEAKSTPSGDVLLKGVDMAHALDPKATDKGFRSFKLSKIVGEIEILN